VQDLAISILESRPAGVKRLPGFVPARPNRPAPWQIRCETRQVMTSTSKKPHAKMNKATHENVDSAHGRIAKAMGYSTALWFVPFVSGIACNRYEKDLIRDVLRIMGRAGNPTECDKVFWFVRKKMLLFNAGTYIPHFGTALQVMEVYAMGQFAILCSEPDKLADHEIGAAWNGIEHNMFSGRNLVAFYEGSTGRAFPENIREPFEIAIDQFSSVYFALMRVPGLARVQEVSGETIRKGIAVATKGGKKLMSETFKKSTGGKS
jgi:hypothetical protein